MPVGKYDCRRRLDQFLPVSSVFRIPLETVVDELQNESKRYGSGVSAVEKTDGAVRDGRSADEQAAEPRSSLVVARSCIFECFYVCVLQLLRQTATVE